MRVWGCTRHVTLGLGTGVDLAPVQRFVGVVGTAAAALMLAADRRQASRGEQARERSQERDIDVGGTPHAPPGAFMAESDSPPRTRAA